MRNGKAARLNIRLAAELKKLIEDAALYEGQTVSDFAIATLVRAAHEVIHRHTVTVLSNRDRDRFLALLDDANLQPNQALINAFKKHRAILEPTPRKPRRRKARPSA